MINKDTNICISIASNPGNFGANFHNQAYKALGMNWVYLPRKVSNVRELKSTISAVRSLNIMGCSVSMPLKEKVIEFLDKIDLSAEKTGAVNTIVNRGGLLTGYNTDLFGAKKVISNLKLKKKKILIIGAGGVSKAIISACLEKNGDVTIINRTDKTSKSLANKFGIEFMPWKKLENISGYMLINTTPVGMLNNNKMIVSDKLVDRFNVVMDVVVNPRLTKLIRVSSLKGKFTISGIEMCVHQAKKQFNIYTGKEAPKELINSLLKNG
tara:strand:- start:238 stop:1041 length:804 start_codon:yes stop_codon:yes gene_type:complete